jgi:hypothetical protein
VLAQLTEHEAAVGPNACGGRGRRRVTRFLDLQYADASVTVMDVAGATVRGFRICTDYLEFRSEAEMLIVHYRDAFGAGARIGASTIRIASDLSANIDVAESTFKLQETDGWLVLKEGSLVLAYCGARNLQLWAANDVSSAQDHEMLAPIPYAVSVAAGAGGREDVLFSRAVPMRGVFGINGRLFDRRHRSVSGRNAGGVALLAAALTLFGPPGRAREGPGWIGNMRSEGKQSLTDMSLALGDATALASILSGVEAVQDYYRGP